MKTSPLAEFSPLKITSTQTHCRNQVDEIIKMRVLTAYKMGYSTREVGRMIGQPHTTVWWNLGKMGPNVLRSQLSSIRRKYIFDVHYFKKYTAENSYWIGFIAADGNVNLARGGIRLKIHSKDADRLFALRKAMNGNFPIRKVKHGAYLEVGIYSRIAVRDLLTKGMKSKNYLFNFPKNIPSNCVRHFIRGYFDGDGCVPIVRDHRKRLPPARFAISGPRNLLMWLKRKLMEQTGVKSRVRKKPARNVWTLTVTSRQSLAKIFYYFYDNVPAHLYMTRKKKRFMILLDKIPYQTLQQGGTVARVVNSGGGECGRVYREELA